MENKRILVLCGGKFAFPVLQQLGIEKFLCGVGVGKGNREVLSVLEKESGNSDFQYRSFPDKESLSGLSSWINELKPDYIFSVSFPFLLSAEVLSYAPQSFINFHPGPLPAYRGPMPLFEVLRYGEKETAITVHFMNEEFDEGAIILKEPIAIQENETYGMLAVKMSTRMADVTLNVAHMLQFGSKIPSQEQSIHEGRYFEKPEQEDTFIRWNRMPADEILSLVRACNPWNQGADAIILGEPVKIVSATHSEEEHDLTPGSILGYSENQGLTLACVDNRAINVQIIACDHGILTARSFCELKKVSLNQGTMKNNLTLNSNF